MTSFVLHPGLALIAGALLLLALRGTARTAASLIVPVLALYLVWRVPDGVAWSVPFLDYQLALIAGDRLSRLFAAIFALMAFGGALFALNQKNPLELPAALLYAGAAIGVTLAGDLITVFVFWELMAIGSTLVIWSAGRAAYAASLRYLMIHLLGGVLLMAGIAGHVAEFDSIAFDRMTLGSPSHWLILAGFLINAGAPPLSAWLPDAYPEASWSGTVFLSAFTTKTAVYVLLRGFPGAEILVWVGLFMVFYGIAYALLENDMRRILAYGIVNQAGFMVAGIGIGTELALNGAAAHAVASILYTALLLMSAGAVLFVTGKRKCSELGGLFQSMPVTAICGIVGALAISSFPLTSGFVSKSMISQAAGDQHLFEVWMLLVAASAGVFLSAGIKFPWFVFFQKDSGLRPPDPPRNMQLAMILFAALCIGLGVHPAPLYAVLPYAVSYEPYTGAHVVTQLQLLLFSGLAFFAMLSYLRLTLTLTLDVDWLYRVLFRRLARCSVTGISRAGNELEAGMRKRLVTWGGGVLRYSSGIGVGSSWPTGRMALWVMVLLLAYLLLYYL